MRMLGKRERLVEAAGRIIYARGYAGTTLARVAADAEVPLGNLYYYFKTREDLASAVIAFRVDELRGLFASLEGKRSPVERLRAAIAAFEGQADSIVERGCPFGGLALDLEKSESAELATEAKRIFSVQLDWFEAQFQALGARADGARARAFELLCAIQGACLVALGIKDADLFRRRLRALSRQLAT